MSEHPQPQSRDLRTVIHDLRQPLSALQMWVDLLGDALRESGEKEQRYVAKIRGEVARMADLLARSSPGASGAAPGSAEEPVRAPAAPLAGACLLVVEDDDVTAEALQLALEGEGASVLLATTVRDALALHEASQPDVVLSDLRIGDGDGCALLAELRRAEAGAGRRTAAIAVTGLDHPETRAAAKQAGFDEIVVKPFSIPRLVEAVGRLLPAR